VIAGGAGVPVSGEAPVRTLCAEHAGPLLRYALHLTSGDRQRATDIVRETPLKAWLHPKAITERQAFGRGWSPSRNLAADARLARPHEAWSPRQR
jgi:RNA polymerase sigma-70 factor (ECF subfamily)